ncbi:hypothetical protein ACFY36_19360 [Actinoplanes sp. NPDC000266]
MLDLFPRTSGTLQWIVGNAIEITSVPSHADRVLDLVENPSYGKSRQMLVMALRRIGKKSERTVSVLKGVVEDHSVAAQALAVLASLDPAGSIELIEVAANHSDGGISAAAKKALSAARKKIA